MMRVRGRRMHLSARRVLRYGSKTPPHSLGYGSKTPPHSLGYGSKTPPHSLGRSAREARRVGAWRSY
jgi:hypothetical protein